MGIMTLDVYVVRDYSQMSDVAASLLIPTLRDTTIHERRIFNFGAATGASPRGLYNQIVNCQGNFDSRRVVCSNIDEYVGLPGSTPDERASHPASYNVELKLNLLDRIRPSFFRTEMVPGWKIDVHQLKEAIQEAGEEVRFVGEHTGKYVDISKSRHTYLAWVQKNVLNRHILNILNRGGIDWQVLGSGRHGHIAFHERGIPLGILMMLVKLDEQTREDAVRDGYFGNGAPEYALTLGARGIAHLSRNVMFMGSGEKRTVPVAKSLIDGISVDTPLSVLQYFIPYADNAKRAIYVVDEIAAAEILGRERQLARKGIIMADLRSRPISSAISPALQ